MSLWEQGVGVWIIPWACRRDGGTSKGKYSDRGPFAVEFDFNRDGFDFSEDEFDFEDTSHGLSEELLLNRMSQRLQGYFQNEFENFKRKFLPSGQG